MKMFKGKIEWEDGYQLLVYQHYFIVCDERGNEVYFENSDGFWLKCVYDERGNERYYEDSDGDVIDIRKKTVTLN